MPCLQRLTEPPSNGLRRVAIATALPDDAQPTEADAPSGASAGRGSGGQRGAASDGAGARQGGPPPIVTFEMTFFDHRTVNGILLPYVITRGANGQTTERWAVSRYRVNESIPADAFTR